MTTKIKGKVSYSDLEGGYVTLEAEDGKTYKLEGDTQKLERGKQVEITGSIETMMGIGFGTQTLTVKSHKPL